MTDQSNDNQTQSTEVTEQVATAITGTVGTESVGTTANLETNTSTPTPQTTIEPNTDFKLQLSDDIKNEASLVNIKDINSLAKGYVHAQKELGARIRIPSQDASAEVKAEFEKKIEAAGFVRLPDKSNPESIKAFEAKTGIAAPATAADYVITTPEGAIVDPNAIGQYKEVAKQLNLTQEQAHKLFQFEVARSTGAFNTAKAATTEVLKKEFGADFDSRLTGARNILEHYKAQFPEAVADIKNNTTGNNPLVIVMAAELARVYQESGLIGVNNSVSFGLTPGEAQSRINEIKGNRAHPYYNPKDAAHTDAINEVENLYKAAYPEQPKN